MEKLVFVKFQNLLEKLNFQMKDASIVDVKAVILKIHEVLLLKEKKLKEKIKNNYNSNNKKEEVNQEVVEVVLKAKREILEI